MNLAYDGSLIFGTQVDAGGFRSGMAALSGLAKSGMLAVTAAIASVGTAMGGAAKAALKVGSDFEAGMSQVAAVSGATGKDLDTLAEKAKEMGAKTKFSATGAAEAFNYMAMAGWKTEDMLGGIEGIMNLAAASGEKLALTSDIVTDALTAFGMAASESGRFADVLAAASSNSNTNVAMMGETFKYVAPVAGALGYSVEDTAAAIGLMANASVKGGQAGTSLRSILTRVSEATEANISKTKTMSENLENLGEGMTLIEKVTGTAGKGFTELEAVLGFLEIRAVNADGSMRPLSDVLQQLREKTENLSEAEKLFAAKTIAGQEALSGFAAIVGASDADFKKLTEAINNSEGAAEQMAEIMQNNLKGSLTTLGSTVEGIGIVFYDNIKVSATNAVNTLIKTLSGREFKNAFDSFSKSTGKLIESVANLAQKAIPAVANAFAFLAANLKEIVGIVGAVYLGFQSYSILSSVAQAVMGMSAAWGTAALQIGLYATANGAAALSQAALNGALPLTELVVATLTGKITLATAAQAAWNLVLAANPIGLVVAAVGALAVGILTYIAVTKDSTDATDELLERTGELISSSKDLCNTLQDSAQTRKKDHEEMENQAGAASKLAQKLFELAEKTNKTAGEKKTMLSMVEQLNKAIPGLNLLYDAENDKLNKQESEIRGVIAANLEMYKVKAAQEDLLKISEDIYQAEKKLNEVALERKAIQDTLVQAERDLMSAIADTNNAYAVADLQQEYNFRTTDLRDRVQELTMEEEALTKAISSANQEFDSTSSYIADVTKSADNASGSLDTLGEAGSEAAEDIANASKDVYESLDLTDKQIEDLEERFKSYEKTATNAFDAIEQKSDVSIEEMIENLTKNAEAMNQWADNLILAAKRGTEEGFLDYLRALGPEGGLILDDFVHTSDEKFNEIQEAWRSNAESVVNVTTAEFEVLEIQAAKIAGETASSTAAKLRDGVPSMRQAGREMAEGVKEGMSPLPSYMESIGDSATGGLITGIQKRAKDVYAAVKYVLDSTVGISRKTLDSHSPSKRTEKEIGKPFMQGVGVGLKKAFPEVAAMLDTQYDNLVSQMRTTVALDTFGFSRKFSANSGSNYSTVSHANTFNITVPPGGGARDQLDARAIGKQIGAETQRELRSRGVLIT